MLNIYTQEYMNWTSYYKKDKGINDDKIYLSFQYGSRFNTIKYYENRLSLYYDNLLNLFLDLLVLLNIF